MLYDQALVIITTASYDASFRSTVNVCRPLTSQAPNDEHMVTPSNKKLRGNAVHMPIDCMVMRSEVNVTRSLFLLSVCIFFYYTRSQNVQMLFNIA